MDKKLTLKQWILDMTGPEDAWAREQYAKIIEAAKKLIECHDDGEHSETCVYLGDLRTALKTAGELE